MIRKQTRVALEFLVIVTGIGLAQPSTTKHVSVQSFEYGQPDRLIEELQEIVGRLDPNKLHPVESGSWEGRVLDAAQQSAEVTLRLRLRESGESGVYTLHTVEGDTMVARWTADGDKRDAAIWLWDTPDYTTFVVERSPSLLQPDDLVRYCEDLFNWGSDPLQLKSLRLKYLQPKDGMSRVVGLGDYARTQLGTYIFRFAAISSQGKAYVEVEMSKPIFSDKYPDEAYRVPERFPPLRSRLGSVPRHALFDELGKGYSAPRIITYPTNRDAIILAELLSRGPLSDVEVRQAIFGSFESSGDLLVIHQRMIAFLQAIQGKRELESYAPAMQNLFLGEKRTGWGWDLVIGRVFSAMEENKIDFSDAALAFLEQDEFTHQSLRYIERNARDDDTLRKLTAITVKPEFEREKAAALKEITRKVASKPDRL